MAEGLITEEEMNERLAFATAKWRAAQAEIVRLRKVEQAAMLHAEHDSEATFDCLVDTLAERTP